MIKSLIFGKKDEKELFEDMAVMKYMSTGPIQRNSFISELAAYQRIEKGESHVFTFELYNKTDQHWSENCKIVSSDDTTVDIKLPNPFQLAAYEKCLLKLEL